ncbi:hypothetical protein DICSQDRAFT_138570 [Dichomitus squalens LYAD-421 SS1]|uniref:Fungal-type protein kinase domain-containing protein n=1 Tax=Dichomitus squalens (strain LYAD-421) TaxID=732165 RepID=R7STP3_DICSQ|nr:uncharacterized protein DICSQDRAFT_138570 [Dichomitus squalens LYAD-421 SS1]EJF59441.1 hypothetical protein DICSQDRAFT_138570 [Dichomitus squalens LYAD-421 SS1]
MMSDGRNTTVFLHFERLMKTYLPSLEGFDEAFPEEKIAEISTALKTAYTAPGARKQETAPENAAPKKGSKVKAEKMISMAWAQIDKDHRLCPGHVLNLSEDNSEGTDDKRYKIDGSFISDADKDSIVPDVPNWALQRLSVEFKRGGTSLDAFDDHPGKTLENEAESRRLVRGQLMSYAERVFTYQHRTALFMIFVNGLEFRVIRWDRSGCIVTEALNYVETAEDTKRLLQFLYAFSKTSPEQQGVDTTAVPLSKDSCGWKRMDALSFAHLHDVNETEGEIDPSTMPNDFLGPADDPGRSPLFERRLLHDDPTATCNHQTDHPPDPQRSDSDIRPVFKYVRTLFRKSLPKGWPRYKVAVDRRVYLIGKPITDPSGLIGRGTRGYVAVEWETQRFVFLKDAWRPHYVDLEYEGDMLQKLNDAGVSCVPTLICHGPVGQQETETSEYSPITGHKRSDAGRPDDDDAEVNASGRPIAPLSSRAKGTVSAGEARPTSSKPRRGKTSEPQKPQDNRGGKGTKRVREEAEVCDGVGLRHMQHYRIVVTEVCLDVTAFRYGEQLARIILDCIQAHGDAYEKCGILHRDVSAGNILILPTIKSGWSLWKGVLSDWELSKRFPRGGEKPKARQPHRTGTWYFMSIRSLAHPHRPLGIPDELESFLHVIVFLAVCYVRSNCDPLAVHSFVEDYFDGAIHQGDNRYTCSKTKVSTIKEARLCHGDIDIAFLVGSETLDGDKQPLEGDGQPRHPLRDLLADLLSLFQARYAVEEWEARMARVVSQAEVANTTPPLPSLASIISSDSQSPSTGRRKIRPPAAIAHDHRKPSGNKWKSVATSSAQPRKPSQETFKQSEMLDSHSAVLDMFKTYLDDSSYAWPLDDKVDNQLAEYEPPNPFKKAKKARLTTQTAMPAIREVDEQPVRAHTGS